MSNEIEKDTPDNRHTHTVFLNEQTVDTLVRLIVTEYFDPEKTRSLLQIGEKLISNHEKEGLYTLNITTYEIGELVQASYSSFWYRVENDRVSLHKVKKPDIACLSDHLTACNQLVESALENNLDMKKGPQNTLRDIRHILTDDLETLADLI